MGKTNLAGDVVEANILTRLPVKTLIRFTAVCKSWYSLISTPYFINLHRQSQKNKISSLHLVDCSPENRIFVKDSCLPEQSPLFTFPDTCDFPFISEGVVGCYNGVVCLFTSSTCSIPEEFSTNYRISLWNPALRINKIITGQGQSQESYEREAKLYEGLGRRNPGYDWQYQCVGFGYHTQTNDYNVIRFFTDHLTIKHVEIYSLASDSWREIELGPNQLRSQRNDFQRFGVYVSYCSGEAYCWLAFNILGSRIILFHMKDETFKELMLPNNINCNSDIFSYKDLLALLQTRDANASNKYSTEICYIWVLKDYDDSKSWTNLCKFDSQRCCVSLLGVVDTDQILLQCCQFHIIKVLNAAVMDKSQMKLMTYTNDVTKARWVSSFSESLALLEGVRSDFPV